MKISALSATARAAALGVATALALSACGGGGGGSSAVPAAPRGGTGTTPITAQQTTTQASVATALQQARTEKWVARFVGPASMSHGFRKAVVAHVRRAASLRGAAATPTPSPAPSGSPSPSPSLSPSPSPSASPSACDGGTGLAVTQNADGSTTIVETGYYDDSCTMLQYQTTTTISAPNASGTMSGKGTETDYDVDGKTVTEYDIENSTIYNANPGSGDMVMSVARYANAQAASAANAVPLDTDYFSCVDTTANTENIGSASISQDPSVPGQEFGSLSLNTTTYTGGLFQTNQTVSMTGTTTNLVDPTGKLAIAQFPLAAGQYKWAINGGTLASSTTETQSSTTDAAGNLLSYTDTIADSADDTTTTITENANGSQYTGVIKKTSTGAVLATFTVNQDGNGTITFADGTTEPVQDWCWN